MKKIAGLAIGISVVIALVMTGTFAVFSDTETADENTFIAGTLDLQVGSDDPCTESIAIGDDENLAPTGSDTVGPWLVKNIGSTTGDLSISIGAIENYENDDQSAGCTDPEDDAGDTSCTAANDQGELGSMLEVAFWMDVDKDNTWSSGDYYLKSDATKVSWSTGTTVPGDAYDDLDNYDSDSWADVQTSIAGNTDIGNFYIEYNWPDGGSSDNQAQTDCCIFDITFNLDQ